MSEIVVRNWKNEAVKSVELDDALFQYPLKEHLIYEAVCAHRAGGRAGTHKTKNRVEVSGGTKKLWKQKHTGRARMGDNRSPLWRHGGTIQGPVPRSYEWAFPKKMRWNAIKSAFAQKLRDGQVVCLQDLDVRSHKTQELETAVAKGLGIAGKALFLPETEPQNLELAARNNPRFKVVRALGVSIVDLLDHDTVILSEPALLKLAEVMSR
jgi:large subunit ribosomal protein L4